AELYRRQKQEQIPRRMAPRDDNLTTRAMRRAMVKQSQDHVTASLPWVRTRPRGHQRALPALQRRGVTLPSGGAGARVCNAGGRARASATSSRRCNRKKLSTWWDRGPSLLRRTRQVEDAACARCEWTDSRAGRRERRRCRKWRKKRRVVQGR